MLAKTKAEDLKDAMICASFTAWQMSTTKKTFQEYLSLLGLSEKSGKIPEKMKKKISERNIALAEKIRKASLKQRNKKVTERKLK